MRTARTRRIQRCWLAAATVLAGGTVLGTCEVRMREALVTTVQTATLTTVGCVPTMLGLDNNSACDMFIGDTTTDQDLEDETGDQTESSE